MTIYVGNLAPETTEGEMRDVFAPYGEVSRVAIKKDRQSGLPRGFGLVEMDRAEEAEMAIVELHGSLLGDRMLEVREARRRSERGRASRGRNGHG